MAIQPCPPTTLRLFLADQQMPDWLHPTAEIAFISASLRFVEDCFLVNQVPIIHYSTILEDTA